MISKQHNKFIAKYYLKEGIVLLGKIQDRLGKNYRVIMPDFHHGLIKHSEIESIFKDFPNFQPDFDCLTEKIILCTVVTADHNIILSIDPSKTNYCLSPSTLTNGDSVWGYVRLAEDNGYIVELGIGVCAFVKCNITYKIGQFDFFTVVKSSKKLVELVPHDLNLTGKQVWPGNRLSGTLIQRAHSSISFDIGANRVGFINQFHYDRTISDKALLFVLSVTEDFILLTQKNVFNKTLPTIDQPTTGTVIRKVFGGVLYSLNNGCFAFSTKSHTDFSKSTIGEQTDLKVLDSTPLLGCLNVTNKKALFLQNLNFSTIIVGSVVDATVIGQHKLGYNLRVSPLLVGLAFTYLVSEATLQINQSVKAKVLEVDPKKRRLILATNPLIVNSTFPMLDSYNFDPVDGSWFTGFVQKCEKSYVIVKFLNNVSGLLHKAEALATPYDELDRLYPVGSVLKVRVLSVEPQRKRMTLSMRLSDSETFIDTSQLLAVSPCSSSNENNFKVNSSDEKKCPAKLVYVPDYHLSDFPEHIQILKSLLSSLSSKIFHSVFFGKDVIYNNFICSLKYSIVRSIQLGGYPSRIEDVKLDMCLGGFVTKLTDMGYHIMIGLHVVGFLPISLTPNKLSIGQSVTVFVQEVDHFRHRIILALSPKKGRSISNILPHLYCEGFLLSYFKEVDHLTSLLYSHKFLKRGRTLKVEIVSLASDHFIGQYKNLPVSLFASSFSENVNPQIGDIITCYLAHWDIKPLHLYAVHGSLNSSEKEMSVKVVKMFSLFALGFFSDYPVFIVTNQTISFSNKIIHPGNVVNCHVKSRLRGFPIVCASSENFLVSYSYALCTVTKITSTTLRVRASGKKGVIHVSSVLTSVNEGDRPLDRFMVGDKVDAYIIPRVRCRFLKNSTPLELSFKPDTPSKPSLSLKEGDWVIGFVRSVSLRRLFIDINLSTRGFLNIIDLQPVNSILCDPVKKFIPGTAIRVCVASLNINNKLIRFELSSPSELTVGQVSSGRVFKHNSIGLYVDLPHNRVGFVHITNLFISPTEFPLKKFPIGSYLQALVIYKTEKIFHLSIKHSSLNTPPSLTSETLNFEDSHKGYVTKLTPKFIYLSLSHELSARINLLKLHSFLPSEFEQRLSLHSVIEVRLVKMINSSLVSALPSSPLFPSSIGHFDSQAVLKVGQGFDWTTGCFKGVPEDKPKIPVDHNPPPPPSLKVKQLDELEIRQIENRLSSNSLIPTSKEDFDRLIIASPNSSIIWIAYITFYLSSLELDKARLISERALKTISFREQKELSNLWVAIINMECLYGSQDSLEDVRSSAESVMGKKRVAQHLCELYIKLNLNDDAERECRILLKAYPSSTKSYTLYASFLAMRSFFKEIKQLLRTALASLPPHKHIKMIVQFSLLEFRFGDYRRGVSLLESVLNNYPSRIDLWFVYVDQLIKVDQIESARQCLTKLSQLPFKKAKSVSILNKFLSFEQQHGNADAVSSIALQIEKLKQ